MAAPTFIQHAESVWNDTVTPKTVTVTVQTGDIIVVGAAAADGGSTLGNPSNDGTALVWTPGPNLGTAGNTARAATWTATADSNRTIIITGTMAGTPNVWGLTADVFRASNGIGGIGSVNGVTVSPWSTDVITTLANSAVFVISADWNVTGVRTYLTAGVGPFTEETSGTTGDVAGQYAVRVGYHADVGATGTKTVGTTAPAGQKVTIIAVEVKGSAAVAPPMLRERIHVPHYSNRARAAFR